MAMMERPRMSERTPGTASMSEGETLAAGKMNEPGKPPAGGVKASRLHVLRAAILMSTDSMLTDLRTIRDATTIEGAQAPVNSLIDRLLELSNAAENASE
jgi:hypothetical protein